MRVLIGNCHPDKVGGGGYYSRQCIKAISSFSEVFLLNDECGYLDVEDTIDYKIHEPGSGAFYDFYIDVNHFQNNLYKNARENIKVVFFPKPQLKGYGYYEIVTISNHAKRWIKNFWGKDSLICKPYSKNITPGKKQKKSIVTLCSFLFEENGHSKRQKELIMTFKNFKDKEWEYNLIGAVINEDYFNDLRETAKGYNVNFYPNASEEEKINILKKSEFMWHGHGYASQRIEESEHYGIGCEEGLKAGCKVYVHNSGGPKEFCRTWDTPEELLFMTSVGLPNGELSIWQTPETMRQFWEKLLCNTYMEKIK